MVCDKCEEKLTKLVVPDKWKDGARNTTGGKDGGRKIGSNRLLEKRSRATSLDDDEQLELIRSTPGPWNITTDLEPMPPPCEDEVQKPKMMHSASNRHKSIISRMQTTATNTTKPDSLFPLVPGSTQKPQGKLLARPNRLRDASLVVQTYRALVDQTQAMSIHSQSKKQEATYKENSERRKFHQAALRVGIKHLTPERVQQQKEIIRFDTLKNEVDIFQQSLDQFIFEMKTPHEHRVNSSVYRHLAHMHAIQDMGIPIYSLGSYVEEENDKIIVPRIAPNFYRQIRRRNAADYIDTDLIPRPKYINTLSPRPPPSKSS